MLTNKKMQIEELEYKVEKLQNLIEDMKCKCTDLKQRLDAKEQECRKLQDEKKEMEDTLKPYMELSQEDARKKAEELELKKQAEERAAYKEDLTYNDLMRYGDTYYKRKLKISGHVISTWEGMGGFSDEKHLGYSSGFLVDTKEGIYCVHFDYEVIKKWKGTSSDAPCYKDGSNILKGDLVSVFGEFKGIQGYRTIEGARNTVPDIYVNDITLLK